MPHIHWIVKCMAHTSGKEIPPISKPLALLLSLSISSSGHDSPRSTFEFLPTDTQIHTQTHAGISKCSRFS